MAEIVKNKFGFANEDLRLAVIGSDEPQYFKDFRKVTDYSGLLLSDPSRLAFAILGFASGVAGLLSLHGFSRTLLAIKDGIKPGALHGSALQLGGVVIVQPANVIMLPHNQGWSSRARQHEVRCIHGVILLSHRLSKCTTTPMTNFQGAENRQSPALAVKSMEIKS